MSLFSTISGFLSGAVGNNLNNNPNDVRKTKSNLRDAGYFEDDDVDNVDNGYITRKTDDSIKRYQRDNGLREDGVLFKGGETERSIGHFVKDLDEAKNLPLYLHDEKNNPVRPATPEEIETLYSQVQSIQHGQNKTASEYDPKKNSKMKNIRIRDDDQNELLMQDLIVKAIELQQNWEGFENYPGELKQAMIDVHFNTGSLTPSRWKMLNKAIKNKDKEGIIREIHRDTKHEKRNIRVQNLLKTMNIKNWK